MSTASWSVEIVVRAGAFRLAARMRGAAAPVAVIGPNGSGKTTLLRTIVGALAPESGRIEVAGSVLFDAEREIALPPEARRVGYVPQGYGLFPHLAVADNVAFGVPAAAARSRAERRRLALDTLAEMGCDGLANRYPATLSGGEKQRVALARAVMARPAILLLDEPLAAMDPAARRKLRASLARRLLHGQRPAIVVTHDARDVYALGRPRVYALEGGGIVQRGTPQELATAPATEFIAEFFAAGNGA